MEDFEKRRAKKHRRSLSTHKDFSVKFKRISKPENYEEQKEATFKYDIDDSLNSQFDLHKESRTFSTSMKSFKKAYIQIGMCMTNPRTG